LDVTVIVVNWNRSDDVCGNIERLLRLRIARCEIVGCRIVSAGTRRLDQWIYSEAAPTHERVEFDTYSFSAAGDLLLGSGGNARRIRSRNSRRNRASARGTP